MTTGLFIGRFQPLHKGHIEMIKALARKLDKVIIGIGSSNKSDTPENPFNADEREMMLELSLEKTNLKFEIVRIPDVNNYALWFDVVIDVCPKFDVVFSNNEIVKKLAEKKGYKVESLPASQYISSSTIRDMLVNNEDCTKYLTQETLHVLSQIKGIDRLKRIYNKSEHNNPPTAVDLIIEYHNPEFKGIVLVKRKNEPFKDSWSLPGGFQEYGDSLEKTAQKEADEETNLSITLLTQLSVYSEKDRDPRGHVNSVGFVVRGNGELKAGDDAAEVKVFSINKLPKLAFDHKKRIEEYLKWKNKH